MSNVEEDAESAGEEGDEVKEFDSQQVEESGKRDATEEDGSAEIGSDEEGAPLSRTIDPDTHRETAEEEGCLTGGSEEAHLER
jgi:hypothetical protein